MMEGRFDEALASAAQLLVDLLGIVVAVAVGLFHVLVCERR